MRLADNVATPARLRATSFACWQWNSTLESVKFVLKRHLHAESTWPNFVTSTQCWLKAFVVSMEFKAKSTLSKPISLSHSKAYNNPKASPTGTEHIGVTGTVLASTKIPSSSRMQIHIHVLLKCYEKRHIYYI